MKKRINIKYPVSEEHLVMAFLLQSEKGTVIDTEDRYLGADVFGKPYKILTDSIPPEFLEDVEEEKSHFQKALKCSKKCGSEDSFINLELFGKGMWNAALDVVFELICEKMESDEIESFITDMLQATIENLKQN